MGAAAEDVMRKRIANLLQTRQGELLETFAAELRRMNSPIMRDQEAARQVTENYARILSDVAVELRDPGVILGGGNIGLSREIAESRVRSGVHPTESLRAAGVLFNLTLDWLGRELEQTDGRDQAMSAAIRYLNDSLTRRVRDASAWYASYLLNEVHRVQTQERAAIARQLHDQVSYGIVVAHQRLDSYRRLAHRDPDRARQQVAEAQGALEEAMETIRGLISELRSSDSVDNLEKALAVFLRDSAGPDVDTDLIVSGNETWLNAEVREEVFLVVREALRNALTHGRPRRVYVRIDIAPHELRATIDDDGSGFDQRQQAEGAGLMIMEERAGLAGGAVAISSAPGKGTRVELIVPILRNADEGR